MISVKRNGPQPLDSMALLCYNATKRINARMRMEQLYAREAELFQALGHPLRLHLLELLREGGRCACELQPELGVDQSTVARHLLTLKRAGVLRSRKEGVRVIYELADERVLEILELASQLIIDSMKERLEVLEARRGK